MPRRSPTIDTVMVAERAASFTKRSIKTSTKRELLTLAMSMLDLTTLEGKDSPEKVRALCHKALRPFERDEQVLGTRLPSCGAVCVYPSLVPTCAEVLRSGTPARRAGVPSESTSPVLPLAFPQANTHSPCASRMSATQSLPAPTKSTW